MGKKLSRTAALAIFCLLAVACGKDQPGPVSGPLNPATGADYFKGFSVHWAPGTYATGGRAQYAISDPQGISGRSDGQSKLDLYLFDDDMSYLLEYWELAGGVLTGATVSGRWYVNETGQLVLLKDNGKIATGTANQRADGHGGFTLSFESSFNPHSISPQVSATSLTQPYNVGYAHGATGRVLPPKLKDNLPKQMGELNTRRDQHGFKD